MYLEKEPLEEDLFIWMDYEQTTANSNSVNFHFDLRLGLGYDFSTLHAKIHEHINFVTVNG